MLKQHLSFSFEQLAFHLSYSVVYRTFIRLPTHLSPSRSRLQSTIRGTTPKTLERAHQDLTRSLLDTSIASLDKLRIDSTVVASNITPPINSQFLDDAVHVISRLLAKSKAETGLKIRFTDQRKASKSPEFRIFNVSANKSVPTFRLADCTH